MTKPDFTSRQNDAIKQMKELNERSIYKDTATEPEPERKAPNPQPESSGNSLFSGLNLPFLDKLKTDGDLTLILGILLLLLSEKADKRLLFALLYILL